MSVLPTPAPAPKKKNEADRRQTPAPPVTVVWRRKPPAASKRPAPKLYERDDSV